MHRIFCLWIPISLTPSMTFHQHRQVRQPFVVSFDTNYFYPPSIYSIFLVESCLMAKWLPVVCRCQTFPFQCLNNIFTPACICWQRSIPDAIELRKLFLEVFNFLLQFLNHSSVWSIKLDIPQWCHCWIWGPTWWWCMRGCFRIIHDYAKKMRFCAAFLKVIIGFD